MKIQKRDKRIVEYDNSKIYNAILKAMNEVYPDYDNELSAEEIAIDANRECLKRGQNELLTVEKIQDIVEDILMTWNHEVAKAYIIYRYNRNTTRQSLATDDEILSIVDCVNEEVNVENSNKNPTLIPTQRDYIAGAVSKDLTNRVLLPQDVVKAHQLGIIHFHDSDYFIQHCYNCCLVNLEDMLQNGTVISKTKIEKPHSFRTACTITTQIIAQVASNQYGGQSITLAHLAPFVAVSREKIRQEVEKEFEFYNDQSLSYKTKIDNIVEKRIREEVKDGVQTLQYQIVTLMTTNGQAPFISIFMYLNEVKDEQTKADLAMIIEEVLKQRIQGTKNEKGVWVTPAFPKLLYVLEEDNIYKNSKYYYLTKLAAKCTAKRMVPDYISEKIMRRLKSDQCFPVMGCRSSLSPYMTADGNYKFYGRFNKGVVTINLVDVACSSMKNTDEFWKIFDERLELCHKALICRYKRLKGTKANVAPILWEYGAISRLNSNDTIDSLLVGGYSSISLGYAGLWECVYYMTGYKLIEPEGHDFGVKVMEYMNKKCDDWNKELNLGFSLYGTPLESTTYKFAKSLQKRFGIIKGVTDKNYVTNSYHIHVTEPIDAFSKLKIESDFQALSLGGAISYIEVPNLTNNTEAVLSVMKFIYDNIMYAELNTKSDYCQKCDYDGEIEIVEDDSGKLIWRCPNCGNTDEDTLNVARRTCGK